jgi:PhnB protein
MKQLNFPTDYQQVMPYLIIKNASGFVEFVKDVFDATERVRHMRDEFTIMHGEVAIGESVIMFADATPPYEPRPAGMFVYVADADAAYEKAIGLGATSLMPVCDQQYGRSGGIVDAYGNTWWITTHISA